MNYISETTGYARIHNMGRGPTQEYYKTLNENYVSGTLTCLKPEVIKKVINTDFPNVLNIEPTNRCNLKCSYCPRTMAKKGIGDMSWQLYKRIIDEAEKYPQLIMLNFHKDGESFLHPRFIDMVRYAKNKNIAKTIHMNTNALCWNERMIDKILDSGLDDITVSLDAAEPETFRKYKGIDCLKKIEEQLCLFFKKRQTLGKKRPFVRVKAMEFSEISKDEIKKFFDKWENIADEVQITGIHSWSGAIKSLEVSDEKSAKRFPCVIMWYSLVINWNGEATVCSVDWNTEIKVGDANKQSLHEIWNSPKLKEARKAQIDKEYNKYGVCKDCVVWVSIGDISEWLTKERQFYI